MALFARTPRAPLEYSRTLWMRLWVGAVMIFLYAPLIVLMIFSFNDSKRNVVWRGFTLKYYDKALNNDALIEALVNSLTIAVGSAIFATCLGVFAARASTRFAFPARGPIMGLIMLPLVLPEIIVSISLLVVLLSMGVTLNIFTVILGHTLICMPYAIAILSTAFNSLDKSLEEAAYDLGETKFSAFRLVILPLVMPGIISSLLMSFTISLDEFIIAFFLAGNEPTLPTYIFSQLRFPKSIPMIMALGTVLVVMSIILLTFAEYFRRRGNARTGANNPGGFL